MKPTEVICEDEEHHEEVLMRNTVVVFDKEENRPKRVCSDCLGKQRYKER